MTTPPNEKHNKEPLSPKGILGIINPELVKLFQSETEIQANFLANELLKMEQTNLSTQSLQMLVTAARAIKSSARLVHITQLADLAGMLEKCFVSYAEENKIVPEKLDLFLQTVDWIKSLTHTPLHDLDQFLQENFAKVQSYMDKLSVLFKLSDEKNVSTSSQELIEEKNKADTKLPIDSTMYELFRQEVESHSSTLNDGLLSLETQKDKEGIPKLLRAAHSIKGAARVVGLNQIVGLAHALEECFVSLQTDKFVLKPEDMDLFLSAIDLLSQLGRFGQTEVLGWLDDNQNKILEITKQLELLARGVRETSPPVQNKPKHPKSRGRVPLSHALAKAAATIQIGDVRPIAPPPNKETSLSQTLTKKIKEKIALPTSHHANKQQDRVLRVTAQNLNRLMGLAGESLVESLWLQPFGESLLSLKRTQNDLAQHVDRLRDVLEGVELNEVTKNYLAFIQHKTNDCRQALTKRLSEFEMFVRRHANLSERLYGEVVDIRMRPFADGVKAFPRMVRDLARQLGKKVKLEIEGLNTSVDRDILEKLEAPLTHLLRNAVDHGIESPKEREEAGKPIEGIIKIEAAHVTGMLSITVSDDGRGIDFEKLRKKIREQKLADEFLIDNLTEGELLEFLFLPGFSTASTVTEISGRGVGLSVVFTAIQEVGGVVRTTSEKGKGMKFHLQLPLTLSVVRALLVEISEEPYAFPLSRIDRALSVDEKNIEVIENRQYFTAENHNIGLVSASQVLQLPEKQIARDSLPVVVMKDRLNRYGVVVDKFLGEKDLVVQELDSSLGKVPDISAGAFMEDGLPILIIDVEDMVRSIDKLLAGGQLSRLQYTDKEEEKAPAKRILVVDDSITVREVECRLLQNHGYTVDTAVNGMDGWNAVRMGSYDLVIADVDMPRMNGIELVKAIKNDPRLQNMPIMIVSYKDREGDRKLGLEAGANYYLTKSSFHDETLLNAVIDLIGK